MIGMSWYSLRPNSVASRLPHPLEGQLEWIKDDNLTGLNLWESDHIFFPWIEAKKFFSAKLEYKGEKIQRYDAIFFKTKKSLQEHYGDQLRYGLAAL